MSFFFLLTGFFELSADLPPKTQAEIDAIDADIKTLKEMKRGYEARALRHQEQAERQQFDDQLLLETRRHLELAEENRQVAAQIQQEIDRLEAQKKAILKKVPGSGKNIPSPSDIPKPEGDGFEDI